MRAINLFPWREKKRKKQNTLVLCGLGGLGLLFVLANLVIALIFQRTITDNLMINNGLHCQLKQVREREA